MPTYEQQRGLANAAATDALAYFASAETIEQAASALERGDFSAWDAATSELAATELRALAECYADAPWEDR